MGPEKQEEAEQFKQTEGAGYLSCQVCGRRVKPDTCSWQENDAEGICCPNCRAERGSCGCSD